MKQTQGTRAGDPKGHQVSRAEKIASYVPVTVLVLVILIAIAVAVQQSNYASDAREFAKATRTNTYTVRESQYRGCVKSGNTLRADVRDEFVDLKQDVLIPVFSEVQDTIPPDAETYHILDHAVSRMNHRIETIGQRIKNVHCKEQYPPLPGQKDFTKGIDKESR